MTSEWRQATIAQVESDVAELTALITAKIEGATGTEDTQAVERWQAAKDASQAMLLFCETVKRNLAGRELELIENPTLQTKLDQMISDSQRSAAELKRVFEGGDPPV